MYARTILIFFLCLLSIRLMGQDAPDFNPWAEYTTSPTKTNPESKTLRAEYPSSLALTEVQNAPLEAVFNAGGENLAGWNVSYNWEVELDTAMNGGFEQVRRVYDEVMDFSFNQKGMYRIKFSASCSKGGLTYSFPNDGEVVFTVQISDSRLTFPNAFSPNGDGQNDFFRPIEYQSIVDFHAAVFNRWGQRVYAWDDVASDGWDGRIGSKYAKDGAYYFVCNATGADGTKYHIKKTITVLTSINPGFSEDFE